MDVLVYDPRLRSLCEHIEDAVSLGCSKHCHGRVSKNLAQG